MNQRILGRTNLSVSEIGFGCWAIGGSGYGPTDDAASLDALDQAWERGVNFFDTADTYGHGYSEKLLGRFLKGKPREEIVVATKAGWDFYHGGSRKNFEADYLRFACEQSLKRLQLETIDLYQLHNPHVELIKNKILLDPLEELRQEGKIRFIGVSIHTEADAFAAMADARVDALQLIVNLLDQKMIGRVLKEAQSKRIGVIAREPLACGLLTGKYHPEHVFDREDHRRRWTRDHFASELKRVNSVQKWIPGDLSLTRAALEFVLAQPEVSTVIPGAKTRAQVFENLLASEDPKLTVEIIKKFYLQYQNEIKSGSLI